MHTNNISKQYKAKLANASSVGRNLQSAYEDRLLLQISPRWKLHRRMLAEVHEGRHSLRLCLAKPSLTISWIGYSRSCCMREDVVWYVKSWRLDRKSVCLTLAGDLCCICYGLVLWSCVPSCRRLCARSRTGQRVRLMNYRFPLTLSPAVGCGSTTPWRQQIARCAYWARASRKSTCQRAGDFSWQFEAALRTTKGPCWNFWEVP